jgi:hypothetical protein
MCSVQKTLDLTGANCAPPARRKIPDPNQPLRSRAIFYAIGFLARAWA